MTTRPRPPRLAEFGFDEALANRLAKLETYNKHHYRPNTYLHKWWARRCGSTFRLILKALVDDEGKRDYYTAGGLENKIILDPMMGGGTTLHEAIRLGANVIGADLDPIPVLQAQASLTDVPLDRLERAFDDLYQKLCQELAPLYATACPICDHETEQQFTLYAVEQSCDCGPVLLIDSTVLRQEKAGRSVHICPRCHAVNRGDATCQCDERPAGIPLVERRNKHCSRCHASYRELIDTPYFARYRPLATVGRCPNHGLFFTPPSLADREQLSKANHARPRWPAADFSIEPGPKSRDLVKRGVANYLDLFSSRQLLYLQAAIALLRCHKAPIKLNLALLISTSLEFNSMLCGYKGAGRRRPGAIRHTFAHHAYTLPYTALENNPLYPQQSSGALQKLFHDRIRRARHWAKQPVERDIQDDGRVKKVVIPGELDVGTRADSPEELETGRRRFLLFQGSSASLELPAGSVDAIVTDPPYFDSVQYSDLAAFFRVWLAKMLPQAANWEINLAESAVDPQRNDGRQYTRVLGRIFAECQRVLRRPHGRLVFTFHHWNPKAWSALTIALWRAGFVLVDCYVVHSENPVSVHIAKLKSLRHDAILVLSPADAAASPHWQALDSVKKDDSYKFCQDCASVLGWMLDSSLTEEQISKRWVSLLAGKER